MTTFIPFSTYISSINPSHSHISNTHKCCSSILSTPSNFDSFSRQKRIILGIFRERGSNFELDKDKDRILNNEWRRVKKRMALVNFHQGLGFLNKKGLNVGGFRNVGTNFELGKGKDGILRNGLKRMKKRVILVRSNLGFGGGGGRRDDNNNARVLGNLALAIGLTYLTMTNQLGWILDAIVSVWLLVVILPIMGLGAFLWWAGRDIVQSSCPNCGNEFQIFRSVINEEPQLCPYCSQPFSVVGNEFVRDPAISQANTFGEAFDDFFSRSKKEKEFSKTIVDVEAEVKDVE